ncbi:hypothetical protein L6452_30115 [Arctium lappa]|uniref:Uncharacterized protein n=1 Tax=Arctium lappa TaxID=4217 RepID=A0ACB8ZI70_ARCLA|nr:hypothetical protein L6452_30115 [Arctium lappa]
MESSVRTITTFLKDVSSHSNEILTIWGMGGIGKTHLANYIFKLHYHDFERSSFLEDIERRCKQRNAILDLQKQLLKDIQYITWMDIHDVEVGTSKIEKLLPRKKTLLVLDGIDHFKQLDVLIGTTCLHSGSKIIITTKEASLTEKCRLFDRKVPPKHTKHLLKGLNQDESLQLLSWHSSKGNPKEIFEKHERKGTARIQGLVLDMKMFENYTSRGTHGSSMQSFGDELCPKFGAIPLLHRQFETSLEEAQGAQHCSKAKSEQLINSDLSLHTLHEASIIGLLSAASSLLIIDDDRLFH